MSAQKLRIGLLGGSFNPPHEGHLEISNAALSRLGLDAIWWLVTPGNPLKDESGYAPYEERLAKARKLARRPDIVVSDFEARRGLRYTVDTLTQMKETNPETHFIWLMGADSFADFHLWKDWRKIALLVPIAVFNRPYFEEKALSGPAAEALAGARIVSDAAADLAGLAPPAWVFISDTNNPISSTYLRNRGKS